MGNVLSDYKIAPKLAEAMRGARNQNAMIFEYLQQHFVDTFKYRIPDADNKSPIRRGLERPFRKVEEISDLYKQMRSLQIK